MSAAQSVQTAKDFFAATDTAPAASSSGSRGALRAS